MKTNDLLYKIICLLIVILTISYICYGVYRNELSRITTEQAEISTVEDTVKTMGFIIRDENRQNSSGENTSILYGSGSGVYVSSVTDGSKVAYGDNVAMKFENEAAAQTYEDIGNLQQRIEYYEKLEKQNTISNSDLEILDERIDDYISDYVDFIDTQNIGKIADSVKSLEKNITTRQISTGEKINFTKIINQLKKEYTSLNEQYPDVKQIKTPYPGYYIGNVDGYEAKADYADVSELTVSKINKLISSSPDNVSENAFGKIIGEFEWYVVCVLPSSVTGELSKGSYLPVIFDDKGDLRLRMKIINITPDNGGNVALVLSSSDMNEAIAKMRIENITVVVKSYTGYKISSQAIRSDKEGNMGVYVNYGGTELFRPITIGFYGNNFVVVIPEDSTDENIKTELQLHDKVIVKGRNPKDGKLLSQ